MIRIALLLLMQARPLAITVTDSSTGRPLPEAIGRLATERSGVEADRLGRIRFASVSLPATVLVQAVGFRPETLQAGPGDVELAVALSPHPISLAGLTVNADAGSDLTPAASGHWVVPSAAIDVVPFALERDPLRALTLVPSVSFSSPLSARPMIRGYDAAENVTRLDGFEVVNPYHVGRVFAAFSADFTQSVDVTVTPHRAADAEALSGIVDLVGVSRAGAEQHTGGAGLSLATVSAWKGWRGPVPGFAGARIASLGVASDVLGDRIGYDFGDGYGHVSLPLPGRRSADVTLYGSSDDLGDVSAAGGTGSKWSNVLVGERARLADGARFGLDLSASFNRFDMRGHNIEARFSRLDISNRFDRLSVQLEARGTAGRGIGWVTGAGYARRDVRNTVVPNAGSDFPATDTAMVLDELQAFGTVTARFGTATLDAGARVDRSPLVTLFQPRARLAVALSPAVVASFSAARASRLYQVITDPQPEPTLSFYDFWRVAGQPGVPAPRIDHVAAEMDIGRGRWQVHLGAYASRGTGLAELRPDQDLTDTTAFRFGDSRTAGLEVRLARGPIRPGGALVTLSYALGTSERRWEDGVWRPWRLDQRHRLRLQGDAPLGDRVRFFALGELRSAQPEVRVSELYFRSFSVVPGDTLQGRAIGPAYLYAPEGSARGGATAWIDVGTRMRIDGPWHMQTTLGFSVTNLVFGPVAPLEPVSPINALYPNGGSAAPVTVNGVPYERRFTLPPVPSVTVRVEF